MGKLSDLAFDDEMDVTGELEPDDGEYPKKLNVDGYDVNHYHDGDIPVYEILDENGNVIEVAHSTNEMHEFTGNRSRDEG